MTERRSVDVASAGRVSTEKESGAARNPDGAARESARAHPRYRETGTAFGKWNVTGEEPANDAGSR